MICNYLRSQVLPILIGFCNFALAIFFHLKTKNSNYELFNVDLTRSMMQKVWPHFSSHQSQKSIGKQTKY